MNLLMIISQLKSKQRYHDDDSSSTTSFLFVSSEWSSRLSSISKLIKFQSEPQTGDGITEPGQPGLPRNNGWSHCHCFALPVSPSLRDQDYKTLFLLRSENSRLIFLRNFDWGRDDYKLNLISYRIEPEGESVNIRSTKYMWSLGGGLLVNRVASDLRSPEFGSCFL